MTGKMFKRKCELKKCIKIGKDTMRSNRGSTMVETLVAFVVLMIVFAALYGMVRFSANLRMRAVDTANVRDSFNTEIYKKSIDDMAMVDVHRYIGDTDQDRRTMFMLQLDKDKTSPANLEVNNNSTEISQELSDKFYSHLVRIPNIDGIGFVSADPIIQQETLVPPKVLRFEYNTTTQDKLTD